MFHSLSSEKMEYFQISNNDKLPGHDEFSNAEIRERQQEIPGKYEEKHNPKPGRKRKEFAESEDYIDKEIGYDEIDPFNICGVPVPSTLIEEYSITKSEIELRNEDESTNDVKTRGKTSDNDKQAGNKLLSNEERRKILEEFNRKCEEKYLMMIDLGKDFEREEIRCEKNQKRRAGRPLNESMSVLPKPKKTFQPSVAESFQRYNKESSKKMERKLIAVGREPKRKKLEKNEDQIQVVPVQASTSSEAIKSVIKAAPEDRSNGSAGPSTTSTRSSDREEPQPSVSIEATNLFEELQPSLDEVFATLQKIWDPCTKRSGLHERLMKYVTSNPDSLNETASNNRHFDVMRSFSRNSEASFKPKFGCDITKTNIFEMKSSFTNSEESFKAKSDHVFGGMKANSFISFADVVKECSEPVQYDYTDLLSWGLKRAGKGDEPILVKTVDRAPAPLKFPGLFKPPKKYF